MPCTTASDAANLRTYITTYATHPNQLLYNGRVMASTFSGETCTFGQGSVASGWSTQFVQQLTGSSAVHFVPSFFVDPSQFNTYSGVIDGMFNVGYSSITFCMDLIVLSGIPDGQFKLRLHMYRPYLVCLETSLVVYPPPSALHCLMSSGQRLRMIHTSRACLQWAAVKRTWQLCLRGFSPTMARQLTTKTWVALPSYMLRTLTRLL